MVRIAVLLIVVVGCAARSDLDEGNTSSSRGDSADASGFDAVDAFSAADVVADATNESAAAGLDAAACLALPEAACTKEPPFQSVVSGAITQCLTTWMCGYANVSFDANGCMLGVEYVGGQIPLEFRACFEATISSQRWPCEMGQTLFAFLGSCTIN